LLVRYDLERLGREVDRDALTRDPGFWRFAPMLPVAAVANRISLGEVVTPIVELSRGTLGGRALVKDEGRLPTASFKARGLALAVSMARELGLSHLAIPTNGNAGAAMAAYAARAGIRATVF